MKINKNLEYNAKGKNIVTNVEMYNKNKMKKIMVRLLVVVE